MATTTTLLLKGGTVLQHGELDHVLYSTADILIRGTSIVEIGQNVAALPSGKVIDCTNKVICPGFIDTHHHVWQTQLKGRDSNQNLIDYMYSG